MSRFLFVIALMLASGLAISKQSFADDGDATRLTTYRSDNSTFFALSIELNQPPQQKRPNDVAIFVDTSASQVGLFQEDSIKALRLLVEQLGEGDQIRIYAVDLDVVPLTDDFVLPRDPQVTDAINALAARAPLGSTDMQKLALSLPSVFENRAGSNCSAIYIGDGVSRGGAISPTELADVVWALVRDQISVSSFAIGPERDVEWLAVVANQTGGNIVVDTDEAGSVNQAAAILAKSIHQSVLWPLQSKLSDSVSEFLPGRFPPIRSDRDTVLIGTLKSDDNVDIEIQGELEGQTVTARWSAKPEKSDDNFSFLPKLIESARANHGLTLPTVGSNGLREVARMMSESSQQLTTLSAQAIASGNFTGAKTLVNAALENDPTNIGANALNVANITGPRQRQQRSNEALEPAPQEAPTANDAVQESEVVAPDQAVPSVPAESVLSEPAAQDDTIRINGSDAGQPTQENTMEQQEGQIDNAFLQIERERIQAAIEHIGAEVRSTLEKARQEVSTGPDRAVSRIKDMMDIVDRDPILDATTRSELQNQLQSALLTAQRQKFSVEENLASQRQNAANRAENERLFQEMSRLEDQAAAMVNRFNSLLAEKNYLSAIALSEQGLQMRPYSPEANAIEAQSRTRAYFDQIWELRRQRQIGVVETLFEVELAHIPFAGNPPLRFPDAEEWARKVAMRKKYASVRLAGNPRDETILERLEETVDFEYEEVPFSDVIDDLRDNQGINILLDESSDLKAETPVTFNVKGIRLKAALRLMLKQHASTYVVKDEVLQILSEDEAANEMVTYVYNIGDLIAPRTPIFGMGGQQGGQQSGGGQGGFGGGQGGGGGGGQFAIDDQLDVGAKADDKISDGASKADRKPVRLTVEVSASQPSRAAWTQFFQSHHSDPQDVRHTVRELMKESDSSQVVDVIYGCMANQQAQSWMYEALLLALQINKSPRSEIERAVMSAVDFSADPDDALFAAKFMSENGMENRAIDLAKRISEQNPLRPEPYVMALQSGKKTDDMSAIRWAVLGVLSQAWPEHREIVDDALKAADAIAIDLQRANRAKEFEEYNRELNEALYRDCVIEVAWTGDADIDLFVEEPGGTVCSRQIPRTTGGGVMMGDRYSRPNESDQVVEHYVLPKGFAGTYRLILQRVWGDIPSGKATVTIYRNFRSPEQTGQTKQIALKNDGAVVVFELIKGRRNESLASEKLSNLVRQQELVTQGMRNEQLAASQSSKALADYLTSKPDAPKDMDNMVLKNGGIRRNGELGYQPVITTLQEGTGTQARAVTADRLHVIVSPAPNFSFIGDVNTFTFAGGATGSGAAGGGAAGGGAAGGGAAGGGGVPIQGAGGGLF